MSSSAARFLLFDTYLPSPMPSYVTHLLFLASAALAHLAVAADNFPEPFNTEKAVTAPMPAEEAAAKMELPPGFHATVFAAEPEVRQPIAMCTDARGRLWVAENYTYAERPA